MNGQRSAYIRNTAINNKKEVLPFPITCMDLEGIMLGELYQRKTNTT